MVPGTGALARTTLLRQQPDQWSVYEAARRRSLHGPRVLHDTAREKMGERPQAVREPHPSEPSLGFRTASTSRRIRLICARTLREPK